jgi:hypothetical protein
MTDIIERYFEDDTPIFDHARQGDILVHPTKCILSGCENRALVDSRYCQRCEEDTARDKEYWAAIDEARDEDYRDGISSDYMDQREIWKRDRRSNDNG